jgi:hypothetical protein
MTAEHLTDGPEAARCLEALQRSHQNDPTTRLQAIQDLRRCAQSPYPRVAKQAQQRLSELDAVQPPQSIDPELAEVVHAWTALRNPMLDGRFDERFAVFFGRLHSRPGALAKVGPRLRRDVAEWTESLSTQVSEPAPRPDPRIARFTRFAEVAEAYDAVATELHAPLVRLTEVLFAVRLRDARTTIAAAIGAESLAHAWELFDRLGQPPTASPEWDDLRDLLDRATADVQAIDGWIDVVTAVTPSWESLGVILELRRSGQRLVDAREPHGAITRRSSSPAASDRLLATWTRLDLNLRRIIEERSMAVTSIDAVRRFVTEYRDAVGDAATDPEWIAPAVHAISAAIEQRCAVAATPDQHLQVVATAFAGADGLPAAFTQRLAALREDLVAIGEAWAAIARGQSRGLSDLERLPERLIPEALRRQLVVATPRFVRLAGARARMSAPGTLDERLAACDGASAVARHVLAGVPHEDATALVAEAAHRRQHLALDIRLEAWDIAGFVEAFHRSDDWDPSYVALYGARRIVEALTRLRVHQNRQSFDVEQLIEWWTGWHSVRRYLPSVSAAFERCLDREEEEFGRRFSGALELTLAETRAAEIDRQLAVRALPLAMRFGCEASCRRLQFRAETWTAAQDAAARGLETLVDHLHREWGAIAACVYAEGLTLLGDALLAAWRNRADHLLKVLEKVVARNELAHPQSPLAPWIAWLALEEELRQPATAQGIARLALWLGMRTDDQVSAAGPFGVPGLTRDECRERVVTMWREQQDWAALAWMYRAVEGLEPPVMPGPDPVEALTEWTADAADRVLATLRRTSDEAGPDLEAERRSVAAVRGQWQRLELFLRESYAGVDWPQPPPILTEAIEAIDCLEEVRTGVERLSVEDLRFRRLEWERLDYLARVRLRAFPPAPQQPVLTRLEPLTRLDHLEGRLRDSAARCGQRQHRTQPGLFEVARQATLEIVAVFRRAEHTPSRMAELVSAAYWAEFPPLAGDLLAAPPLPLDLETLARQFELLQRDEESFIQAIAELWESMPPIGPDGHFDPASHEAYLTRYPRRPPGSRRAQWLFEDLIAMQAQRAILVHAADRLPPWMHVYATDAQRGGIA